MLRTCLQTVGSFLGLQELLLTLLLVDAQYSDGISGALIVHNTDPAPAGFPTWDEEVVLQLSDIYHRTSYDIIADYMSVSHTLFFSRKHLPEHAFRELNLLSCWRPQIAA